ncbi:MAG: acyltransferase [Bacteroidetes bacterium]|nr:MAG: acyltransferase [Bacteroidota bacterium]
MLLKTEKVYFKNLNAIRFIAALGVILYHIESYKKVLKIDDRRVNDSMEIIGPLGVILFFVLSGFLITYLLLTEQQVTGTIHIKNFYVRRILRIWPLYFLIVFLAFFVFPFIDFMILEGYERHKTWSSIGYKLFLFVIFLPNLVLMLFGRVPYAGQTWSIGAEEQFYLVWPWLVKFVKNKWILIAGVILMYWIIAYIIDNVLPDHKYTKILWAFWITTPIQCMSIGGFFALIIFEKNKASLFLQKIIFYKWLQWAVLIIIILLISIAVKFPYLDREIYAVLFGILICNFAYNEHRIFSMENSVLNYLGKISYGLYMYHMIFVVFTMRVLQYSIGVYNVLLYPMVILLTIFVASISYKYFEKPFINHKNAFVSITSGEEAKES